MTATSTKSSKPATSDPRNPVLVHRFQDYLARHNLTSRNSKLLAKRINSNETYVIRYLNNDFRGDLAKFEGQLTDWLDAEIATVKGTLELVDEAFVVEGVHAFLRQVRKHGHIGVGYGEAGKGKTCAARLYAAQDRTSIYVHVNQWSCNPPDIAAEIARAAGIRGLNGHQSIKSLTTTLVEKLSDTDKLIILDNAMRLKESSRRWIVDFWEASRCPIALLGNPEILTQFRANDQHGSRVGIRRDVTLDLEKQAKDTASHMLRIYFPAGQNSPAILKEAIATLPAFGSTRTLEMRCKAAHTMIEAGAAGGLVTDPEEAFQLASTQLITAA